VTRLRDPRSREAVLQVLLPAALLAPSLIWLAQDHTVWMWDQAWYGEVSADLWFWLGHSLRRWAGEMALGLSMKPPGLVWLGQFFIPLRHTFGSVETALLVSILLTQCLALVLLYRIGLRLAPRSSLVAIAGVTMAAGGSIFVGLSHQFFVEPMQAAAVAWVYYIALAAPKRAAPQTIVLLALAMAIGLLAKADTPLYCLVPCVYLLGVVWRKRTSRAEILGHWKARSFQAQTLLLGALSAAAALWYWINIKAVWQHIVDSSSNTVALQYGTLDSWPHKMAKWFAVMSDSFFSPFLGWLLFAALAAAAVFGVLRVKQRRGVAAIEPVFVLSVLQLLMILSVLSNAITVEPRFLYAAGPSIAIVFMQLCALLPSRVLTVLILACGAQWAVVNAESLAIQARLKHQSPWLLTPSFDGSRFDDLARVVSLTSTAPERYNIVAVESPWMNANAAAFFAAKNRLRTGVRSYYTSLGYAEADVGRAMRRIEDFGPRYVITIDGPMQTKLPDFLNVVSLPVLRNMQQDRRFSQVPFPSRNGVLVFRYRNGDAGAISGSSP